jgi:hypothetical protein
MARSPRPRLADRSPRPKLADRSAGGNRCHRSARLVETDMLRGRPGARLALLIETSSRSA